MWVGNFLISHVYVSVCLSHQDQSKISTSLQILCSRYTLEVGGLHLTEMHSCLKMKIEIEMTQDYVDPLLKTSVIML